MNAQKVLVKFLKEKGSLLYLYLKKKEKEGKLKLFEKRVSSLKNSRLIIKEHGKELLFMLDKNPQKIIFLKVIFKNKKELSKIYKMIWGK